MDKTSALSLLGLPPGAPDDAIAAAYRQRVTDLKLQLSNAPAGMKSIYERNLAETETAFRYLNAASQEWLPSAEKVSVAATNSASAKAAPAAATPGGQGLLQPVNKVLFAVTLVALAAAAFFGVQWKGMKKTMSEITKGADPQVLMKSLENGTFTIVNTSDSTFYVEDFKVAYLENGELKTHKETPEKPIPVQPGRPVRMERMKGTEKEYPGMALFYSLTVSNEIGKQKTYSGTHHEKELQLSPKFQ